MLHQDVGWFDTREVSALSAEIQDDLSKIQDAFSDKFGNGPWVGLGNICTHLIRSGSRLP